LQAASSTTKQGKAKLEERSRRDWKESKNSCFFSAALAPQAAFEGPRFMLYSLQLLYLDFTHY